jgi:apolipoprotein N-acyltransferase
MIRNIALSAGGGLFLALAFPPYNLSILAWVAFVPLFAAIARDGRPAFAALSGACFGAVFFAVDVSWVYRTLVVHGHFHPVLAFFTFVGLIATLSLFTALFGFLLSLAGRRIPRFTLFAPFLWIAVEYLRAISLTGFPWDLAGYSQANRIALMQIAAITGIYGVSFLVVLMNVAVWEVVNAYAKRKPVPIGFAASCLILLGLAWTYGYFTLAGIPEHRQTNQGFGIGILQGNIPQEIKWDERSREYTFATYERLGAEAVAKGAQLLVWPETSVPVVFGEKNEDWQRPGRISQALGTPMLIGAPAAEMVANEIHFYNSAFLVHDGILRERYDKIHLVPFGEYMPLSWLLPLGPGIAAREADYTPGTVMRVMQPPNGPPFSVLICYEAIFPELSRAAVANGARLLINITNDGWFGETAAPYQHFTMAKVRSIETGTWLVRCANTGISAVFDPAGRTITEIPLGKEGTAVVFLQPTDNAGTFYTRFGDIFAMGCLGFLGILGFATSDMSKFFMSMR